MTLHILKRRAELHFAQEVRQLKKQFVRYDQKSVDTTVSKRVCVCACVRVCVHVCVCVCVCYVAEMWTEGSNNPACSVCNTRLYQQGAVFIEIQETQENIPYSVCSQHPLSVSGQHSVLSVATTSHEYKLVSTE